MSDRSLEDLVVSWSAKIDREGVPNPKNRKSEMRTAANTFAEACGVETLSDVREASLRDLEQIMSSYYQRRIPPLSSKTRTNYLGYLRRLRDHAGIDAAADAAAAQHDKRDSRPGRRRQTKSRRSARAGNELDAGLTRLVRGFICDVGDRIASLFDD